MIRLPAVRFCLVLLFGYFLLERLHAIGESTIDDRRIRIYRGSKPGQKP